MRLSEWLKNQGKTQEWLARALGVTQGRVSQIARGGTDSLPLALKIEKLSKGAVTTVELLRTEAAE